MIGRRKYKLYSAEKIPTIQINNANKKKIFLDLKEQLNATKDSAKRPSNSFLNIASKLDMWKKIKAGEKSTR